MTLYYRRSGTMTISIYYGLLTLMMLHRLCASDGPISISQISPKSNTANANLEQPNIQTSSNLELPHSIDSSQSLQQVGITEKHNTDTIQSESDSDHNHIRIERSASPILHDISSKSSFDQQNKQFEHLDSNDVETSGRYFNLIQPTTTVKDGVEVGDMTKSERTGKDLSLDPFLAKGGPRSITSGSPISPTSVTLTSPTAILTNNPRQNPNPDIQDIITGIVKLLNGNVNVHANTQPAQASRRPYTTRINNRGPPRISEAQPLPNEYEQQPPTITMRPPPYPFDRPDTRPFINGLPMPEQTVPSMQQNYRPGFVSQNRPPWQRPRPRPPITGNRRPIPPYKPIPTMPEYHPEDEYQLTTIEIDTNSSLYTNTTEPIIDNGYEVEEQNSDDEEIHTDIEMSSPATVISNTNKDDFTKKSKPSEKKQIAPVTPIPDLAPTITTIIQSTSEVNIAQYMTSTPSPSTPDKSNDKLESSFKESNLLIQSSSVTPTLRPTVNSNLSNQALTQPPLMVPSSTPTLSKPLISSDSSFPYHPRPGLVLDDPEFKPGGGHRPRPQIQPTRPVTPPGYGEIFDVTLSAIQGPSGSGSQQTINIKPYGHTGNGNGDIIVSAAGDDGFVSIDGKRTYINLFGESTDAPIVSNAPSTSTSIPTSSPIIKPTQTVSPGITGTGYAVVDTEPPIKPTQKPAIQNRPHHYRPRPPQQPPVRIDTCIVGDDSTCDAAQNERCKTEIGVSSCHCRPGYARRKHREPCRRVVSLLMSLRVDKYYERRIVWDKLLADANSEAYAQLSYESVRAIDSAMSMTPFSDEFMLARVNKIYNGDAAQGAAGVFVNLTLELEENGDTLRPNLKSDIQKHLLGVIHRRNNNIGNSVLYVDSPPGSISNLQDLDECSSPELNDCHAQATCSNIWGSFRCACNSGLRDPWSDQPQRAGRECHTCPDSYCNDRGTCSYENGNQKCTCAGSYYGAQCEIDGEVLGVAIGASVTAVIIIILTLVCLVMWSRRWHREQKNAMGSPVFGYMTGAQVKQAGLGQPPYQVTLEDRMRWAQIADVMAQSNHYAAEPVGSTRPSSAMFGYPNLHTMNTMTTMSNMGTLGNMSMAGTLPMHSGTLPPVPMPRYGYGLSLHSRSNGMRTLENSSSSEEEDRADLLGRNFQVPRPKSRSNASVTKQSGIYYDVDYEPSGCDLYGGTQTTTASSNPIPGPQGIPMSTYTSGRAPSAYYMNK